MASAKMEPVFSGITKEALCATPELISAKVSPNGKWIARIGADDVGIANVSIAPVKGMGFEPLSSFQTPNIIQFFWSGDSRKILVLRDENGTGQLELHGFDIESKEHLYYTEEYGRVNAKIIQLSADLNQAVIGLNHRNPHYHDLYLLDLDTGRWELLLENDRYAKFLYTDQLELVLKMEILKGGAWKVFLANGDLFCDLSAEDAFQTEFLSSDGQAVYFLDNRNCNTNRLTWKSLVSPFKEQILGSDLLSDVDAVLFLEGKPAAFASYYTQRDWHPLVKEIKEDLSFLQEKLGRNFEVVNQSRDGDTWIVSISVPDKGTSFWIYHRGLRELTCFSEVKGEELFPKMYEMVVSSRDGKQLVCYYTLPKEYDKGGVVESPIPLVVVPHGGPFKVRDKYEFDLYHQWLASCGYAVLSVNFRLSSGFGKEFVNAGNGQWGKKAHLDVIDGVEACIAKGITERGKLAVFGGSYGGFESLASLTFSPGYYTCCVSICGPSNLKTVLQSVPEFWEFTSKPLSDHKMFFTKRAFITSMGGDPEDKKGAKYLEQCSPLNHLENIQTPLLLIHGKNDHVVTEKESEQIYESMKARKQEVTYILFPNEGHRFGNRANKLMCFDEAERFLSKYLNGKYAPVDAKLLEGATGEIFK